MGQAGGGNLRDLGGVGLGGGGRGGSWHAAALMVGSSG